MKAIIKWTEWSTMVTLPRTKPHSNVKKEQDKTDHGDIQVVIIPGEHWSVPACDNSL